MPPPAVTATAHPAAAVVPAASVAKPVSMSIPGAWGRGEEWRGGGGSSSAMKMDAGNGQDGGAAAGASPRSTVQQALSNTTRAQAVEAMPCEGCKKRLDLGSYAYLNLSHSCGTLIDYVHLKYYC